VQRLRELAELESPAELTCGVSLLATVRGAIELLRPLAESRGLHITFDSPADCEVGVRQDRLERAIRGILSKAIDRSQHGGKLLISISLLDDTASLRVADQGPAIGRDELAASLDPFQKNPAFRMDLTQNGSLEWCFAKRVAETSGGAFVVDNRFSRGCEVWMHLPYGIQRSCLEIRSP